MVIVKIYGGLGNQMFQYATGRAIARRRRTVVRLDTTFFANQVKREFMLPFFRGQIVEAGHREIRKIVQASPVPTTLVKRVARRFGLWDAPKVFSEAGFSFDSEIMNAPRSCYLDGYWQSYRYFQDCQTLIRREFQPRHPLSDRAHAVASEIENVNALSLHLRRGDYAHDPTIRAVHGLCPLEYYHHAIRRMKDQHDSLRAFVFSDEPEWAKANFSCDLPLRFVDDDRIEDAESLMLMTRCRHHVIANSSYSWWGAWLSPYKDKTVIAPKKWFDKFDADICDLLPAGWRTI